MKTDQAIAQFVRDQFSQRIGAHEHAVCCEIADGHAVNDEDSVAFAMLKQEHKKEIDDHFNHREPDRRERELIGAALAGKGGAQ